MAEPSTFYSYFICYKSTGMLIWIMLYLACLDNRNDEMYDDDTVRHSTHVYAGHGMERIEKYAVIDQTESIFVDRFL